MRWPREERKKVGDPIDFTAEIRYVGIEIEKYADRRDVSKDRR
jgi:hypothetical protein